MRVKNDLKQLDFSEYKFTKVLGTEQGIVSKFKKQSKLPGTARLIEIA